MNMEQQEQNPTASEKSVEEIVTRVSEFEKNIPDVAGIRELVKGLKVHYLGADMEILDVEGGIMAHLRDTKTGQSFSAPVHDVFKSLRD